MMRMLKVFWVASLIAGLQWVVSAAETYSNLPVERRMLFNQWVEADAAGTNALVDLGEYYSPDWSHTGSGSVIPINNKRLLPGNMHTHQSGWFVFQGRTGSPSMKQGSVSPLEYDFSPFASSVTNWQAALQSYAGAYVVSPILKEGAGTLYFNTIHAPQTASAGLAVQIATNRISSFTPVQYYPLESTQGSENWITISNLTVSTLQNLMFDLQIACPTRVRLYRTTQGATTVRDNNLLVLDNICISYPRPSFALSTPTATKIAGQPSSAKLTCIISGGGSGKSDYTSRTVIFSYKGNGTEWLSAPATYVTGSGDGNGNQEEWQTMVDFPEGTDTTSLSFFCTVSLAGNRYLPIDYTQSGVTYWPGDGAEPSSSGISAEKSVNVSDWSKTAATSIIAPERRMLFNNWEEQNAQSGAYELVNLGDYYRGWKHSGANPPVVPPLNRALLKGSNHTNENGWSATEVYTGTRYGIEPESYLFSNLGLSNVTNWMANFKNVEGAELASPYYVDGVGALYFDLKSVESPQDPILLDLVIATNMYDFTETQVTNLMLAAETNIWGMIEGDPGTTQGPTEGWIHQYRYNWQVAESFSLTNDTLLRVRLPLMVRSGFRFKLIRKNTFGSNKNSTYVAADNFQVSPPPSDVVIEEDPLFFDPPYPGPGQMFDIRCRISNVDMRVPTTHEKRFVTLKYRWRYLNQSKSEWHNVEMKYTPSAEDLGDGNHELWVGTVPGQSHEGTLEYAFSCDFDGFRFRPFDYTQSGYLYLQDAPEKGTESLSPRMLGTAPEDDAKAALSRGIRRAKSDYQMIYLNAHDEKGQITAPIAMRLLEDNTWYGWIPLNVGWIQSETNLTCSFNFMAVGQYLSAEKRISTETNWFSEVNQGVAATPPSGGKCSPATSDQMMQVFADPIARYLLVKLDLSTMDYTVCRADYQNFDQWVSENVFTESGGQSKKLDFRASIEDWSLNEDDLIEQYFVGVPSSTNVFQPALQTMLPTWEARSAAYVQSRGRAEGKNIPDGAVENTPNVAMRLMGVRSLELNQGALQGFTQLGSVFTTRTSLDDTVTDGVKQLSFTAHVAQPFDPGRICLYNGAYQDGIYTVNGVARCANVSPERFSVSLIALYRDNKNFMEFRVEQISNPSDRTKGRLALFLNRWVDGAIDRAVTNQPSTDVSIVGNSMAMQLAITGSSVSGKFGSFSVSSATFHSGANNVIQWKGTCGFVATDTSANFSSIQLTRTVNNVAQTPVNISPVPDTDGTDTNWNTQKAFTLSSGSMSAIIPSQELAVYGLATVYNDREDLPDGDQKAWTKLTSFTVKSFNPERFTFTPKMWQSSFIRLGVTDQGISDVVVDELSVSSWHGKSSQGDIMDGNEAWTSQDAWIAGELVSGSVSNQFVQLDNTRAAVESSSYDIEGGRGQLQSVKSTLLRNGVGSLEFDYRVIRPPVKLTVQYRKRYDSSDQWESIGSLLLTEAQPEWKRVSFYAGRAGTQNAGYLRVVNDMLGGAETNELVYTNGWADVDNLVAWDEPFIDDSSWKAYNAKITAEDASRLILDESRGCYLNNSETEETSPVQDRFDPFLQAPVLQGGLGEISFDARLYDAADGAAYVYVFATETDWYAQDDSEWKLLTTIKVDSIFYERYSFNAGEGGEKYKGVRLATRRGGQRVCLENVSISEPIYPGFDITNTRPICQLNDAEYRLDPNQQPLDSDKIGIEARLSNMRMSPSNISVYVDYYIGTNVWGVENWRNSAAKHTLKMVQDATDPQIYRTSVMEDIGYVERDEIVQYQVWARCTDSVTGTNQYTIRQGDLGFENPSWYEPVNLNRSFASQGWSPYFIVYGIPIGTVFINEVNLLQVWSSQQVEALKPYYYPYVEIAVPETVSLKDWKLAFISDGNGFDRGRTNTLTLTAVEKSAVSNGYAFYVVGESSKNFLDTLDIAKPAFIDREYPGLFQSTGANYGISGLQLVRPMGMIEQGICLLGYQDSEGYIEQAREWGAPASMVFAGTDRNITIEDESRPVASISVVTGNGNAETNWLDSRSSMLCTPGQPNWGQVLPDIPQLFPGISNVIITASLASYDNATQNGATNRLSFKVSRGSSTNITYQMKDWYRVVSLKITEANGSPVDAFDSAQADANPYVLQLQNVQSNMNIVASVDRAPSIPWLDLPPSVARWLLTYPDKPLGSSIYNGNPMSLTELYWFNADPTADHQIEGKLLSVERDANTNFYLTASLTVDGAPCTGLQTVPGENSAESATFKVRIRQNLLDDWMTLRQYTILPDSFGSDSLCRIFVPYPNPKHFIFFDGWTFETVFFQWQIAFNEMNGSAAPVDMTNCPVANP